MTEQEAKDKVKEFFDSLTPEQLNELKSDFKKGFDDLLKIKIDELNSLKTKREDLINQKNELSEQGKTSYNYEFFDKKNKINDEIRILDLEIKNQENVVKSLENGGSIIEITDQYNHIYNNIPDYRKIDTNEFNFDEDTILSIPVPKYVPEIDEDRFKAKSFIFDTIRVTEDSYLISINGYREAEKDKYKNLFVVVTLDQLVLIIDYYFTKLRALNQADADSKNKRAEEYYDSLSEDVRKRYVLQKGFYHSLPATVKKKISEAEFEKLDLQGREALYKPYKRYGVKRLVSSIEDDKLPTSFHKMYEHFINKDAILIKKLNHLGREKEYANPIVWKYWSDFREMINFKIKDIKIQREDYSETYKQAIETSFGESNVDTILKEKLGILVKRQNGEKIKPFEISQIENGWIEIQKVYGNLKENALKYNLKISHSGDKLIFASKALGVFIPQMGTIGVSHKLGEIDFKSTFAHESAHFIDFLIGELNGKRWATDNYESLAGKIAFTFRNSMNKSKSEQTDYINSTKECFARCFQQYFGVMTGNLITSNVDKYFSDKPVTFYEHPNFVNESNFNTIKPLVEEFLKENLVVFETTIDANGVNDLPKIVETKETETSKENNEILEAIETFEKLKAEIGGSESELKEWNEAIETFKMLI
jgi:hypothetical protein